MDITPLIPEGRQIIQGYSAGAFKVSGKSYSGAIIVTPTGTQPWNVSPEFPLLNETDFADLAAQSEDIDVVLLGSGARGEFFPPTLRATLKQKGLVIETMDTGAACRTYNVLMAEGRRVAAALLPL
jgi:uncharacterized protein